MFYAVIIFKCWTSGNRRKEQLIHDISHKGYAMDLAWLLTTSGGEPKHQARKAHKKTRMVAGTMLPHMVRWQHRHIQKNRIFLPKSSLYISTSSPWRERGVWEGSNRPKKVCRERERESSSELLGECAAVMKKKIIFVDFLTCTSNPLSLLPIFVVFIYIFYLILYIFFINLYSHSLIILYKYSCSIHYSHSIYYLSSFASQCVINCLSR